MFQKNDNFCRMPIKAAVAAAAEHIAGILPPHLVYSPAHETAVEVHEMNFFGSLLNELSFYDVC